MIPWDEVKLFICGLAASGMSSASQISQIIVDNYGYSEFQTRSGNPLLDGRPATYGKVCDIFRSFARSKLAYVHMNETDCWLYPAVEESFIRNFYDISMSERIGSSKRFQMKTGKKVYFYLWEGNEAPDTNSWTGIVSKKFQRRGSSISWYGIERDADGVYIELTGDYLKGHTAPAGQAKKILFSPGSITTPSFPL
ncbi:hypothetical protein [Paenibacillus eucommiae]|uniref:Uncharacterized protein n=1 Tax=Paenibacillus eucommiae TaxID=1355755 RepID=A0ABS4ISF0_9BACL|nr:hypothetical protein [Paenibacillus eucommiae]MBP1990055.1 hypothetical protein [Paenibacillus eucommiae]